MRPDTALLDYRLGSSTTEPLLNELQGRQIPICVLTGYGRDGFPVLEKPFGVAELLREMQQLCG